MAQRGTLTANLAKPRLTNQAKSVVVAYYQLERTEVGQLSRSSDLTYEGLLM